MKVIIILVYTCVIFVYICCVVFCVGVCQLLLSRIRMAYCLCLADGNRLISSGYGRTTIWDIKVTPLVVQ